MRVASGTNTTATKAKTQTNKSMSLGNSSSKTSTSTTQTTGTLKNAQMIKNYTAIKSAAAGLQTHTSKLMATGDDSLFAKAAPEKTDNAQSTAAGADATTDSAALTEKELAENKGKLVKEITSFVEDYNTMVSSMTTTGGTLNNIYLKQIKNYATQSRASFKEIGITQKSNGTLSINQKTMKASDTTDLQKLFGKTDCFAAKVSEKSEIVETKASATITSLNKSKTSSYNNYGYLSDDSASSGTVLNSKV